MTAPEAVFVGTLLDGLRATLLRPPKGRGLQATAGTFVALIGIYVLTCLVRDFFQTPSPLLFQPAGLFVPFVDALLTFVLGWLLAALAGRRSVAVAAASILLAATAWTALLVHWPLAWVAEALAARGHVVAADAVDLVALGWWFLVILAFVHWLAPRGLLHALTAAVLGYAVSALPWTWLPAPPLLETDAYAWPDPPPYAPDTEDAAESPIEDFDAEDVMYRQPALLDAAIARLVPQRPGIVDLYAITFAGDGAERVFRNEAEYAATLFAQRFDAEGRTLVLANSADSLDATPLATWTALHRALQAMAGIMDPDEDVLLLYLTTHGSEEHELLVALDPLPLNQILPVDVADALRTSPSIRWKVLIVNACYSGGFVDALHDDSTMVITSARPDRTSFGCGVESDITYFGQAFLVEALNRTTSLPDAFRQASVTIAERERTEGITEPSEPGIASTPSIEAKLATLQARLPDAPAVPFAPAPVD